MKQKLTANQIKINNTLCMNCRRKSCPMLCGGICYALMPHKRKELPKNKKSDI